jgi:hypothetical protein
VPSNNASETKSIDHTSFGVVTATRSAMRRADVPARLFDTQIKAFFAMQTTNALVIHLQSLPPQCDPYPAIAVAHARRGNLAD